MVLDNKLDIDSNYDNDLKIVEDLDTTNCSSPTINQTTNKQQQQQLSGLDQVLARLTARNEKIQSNEIKA